MFGLDLHHPEVVALRVDVAIFFFGRDGQEPSRATDVPEVPGHGVHQPVLEATGLPPGQDVDLVIAQSPVLRDGVQQGGCAVLDQPCELEFHVARADAELHLRRIRGEVDHELARDPARFLFLFLDLRRRRAGDEQHGAERQSEGTQHGSSPFGWGFIHGYTSTHLKF